MSVKTTLIFLIFETLLNFVHSVETYDQKLKSLLFANYDPNALPNDG